MVGLQSGKCKHSCKGELVVVNGDECAVAGAEVGRAVFDLPILGISKLLPRDVGGERLHIDNLHILRHIAPLAVIQREVIQQNAVASTAGHSESNMTTDTGIVA